MTVRVPDRPDVKMTPRNDSAPEAAAAGAAPDTANVIAPARITYPTCRLMATPSSVVFCYANTPFRTLPSCANALVVPSGSDVKLKPCAFDADHVIVALHSTRSPAEPLVVTPDRSLTGGVHRMSKLHVASTAAGTRNLKNALGMLK